MTFIYFGLVLAQSMLGMDTVAVRSRFIPHHKYTFIPFRELTIRMPHPEYEYKRAACPFNRLITPTQWTSCALFGVSRVFVCHLIPNIKLSCP